MSKAQREFEKSGNELRRLRLKVGLTQSELGQKLKVHSQFVSNWERGICAPPKSCFKYLSKVLKVDSYDRELMFEAVMNDASRAVMKKWGLLI